MVRVSLRPFRDLFETQFPHKMHFFHPTWTLKQPQILFMFKVKYVDSIMMLVRLDLNLIVSLFQHKCEVSETVSTTTLAPVKTSQQCPCVHSWFNSQKQSVDWFWPLYRYTHATQVQLQ